MLKNASAFGDSLMSPLVLAYAIVDTVLLLVVLDFGITLARDIQSKYEHIPELKKLISLATIGLELLIFAYKVYTLPTSCLVVQPTDLIDLSHSGTPTAFGDFIRTWSQTLSQMNATAMSLKASRRSAVLNSSTHRERALSGEGSFRYGHKSDFRVCALKVLIRNIALTYCLNQLG